MHLQLQSMQDEVALPHRSPSRSNSKGALHVDGLKSRVGTQMGRTCSSVRVHVRVHVRACVRACVVFLYVSNSTCVRSIQGTLALWLTLAICRNRKYDCIGCENSGSTYPTTASGGIE